MTRAKDISKIITDADLSGTLDVTGTVTAGAVAVDNITIDATEIDSTSALTLDSAGTISLDADSGSINLLDGGVTHAELINSSNDFIIKSSQSDKDIIFQGVDGISLIEAMRIDMSAGGNVGIGTSSPVADLHVKDSSGSGQILVEDADGGRGYLIAQTNGEIDLYRGNEGTGGNKSIRIRANDSSGTIQFQTGGSNERIRITSAGNVGIGTSSPSETLDVVGDAKATRLIGRALMESSSGVLNDTFGVVGGNTLNTSTSHGGIFFSKNASSYSLLVGSHDNTFQSLVVRGDTRVGIGINVGTSYHFQVSNLSGSGVVAYFMATSGVGVYLSNGANSWSTASDETLKENINELDKQKSYENIKNIRAVNYKYIADEDDDTKRIGFIAQDWQTKYPEMIVADAKDNDKLGLNYTETIPVLLSALQKAQEKIEALETENATQSTQIADLINRVTALETA